MAVISNISVGDVIYYEVDDIPTHEAPKGSIALMGETANYINSNGFIYINNDGGDTWLKCITPSWGEVSLTNATNAVDFDTLSIGGWYAFNAVPSGGSWVLNTNSNSDWILSTEGTGNDDLKYTGSTTFRGLVRQSGTIRGGGARYVNFESGVSFNFIVPLNWNEGFTNTNADTMNIQSQHVVEFDTDDYILGAISPISREAGGGGASTRSFISRHQQVSALKIDEPLIPIGQTLLSEDWGSGDFSGNSWTRANDTTNKWEIGSAYTSGSTYGVYGSDDGGTTSGYQNVNDISHLYIDITFPSSATTVTLTFDWNSNMDDNGAGATEYDYGALVITDTGTTPTAGSEVATALATAGGNGRINEDGTNLGKYNSDYKQGGTYQNQWYTDTIDLSDYAGEIKRLVWTFKDDGINPSDLAPAFAIANILITYTSSNIY